VRVIEKGQLVAGRYRLMDSIGSGGMGVVWQARDERLERTVAIKQLLVRPGLTELETEGARRRAMREARIAARLQHRNAIALFDVAEHDGEPCLVMEYLRSRSLSVVLAEKETLPAAEVAEIGSQVAAALAAAHAAGIVHRDVKPGNILLDETGNVKITDFGISRAVDDGTVTQTGMLAGTPAYLAPEVARGQDTDQASDVFSLGATLYHAVEGAPPFGTNGNALALLHAVASGNVPPPRKAGALAPVLMRLLRAEPDERPTMAEAVEALTVAMTMPALPVPEPPTEHQTVPVVPPAAATQTLPPPPPLPPPAPRPARPVQLGKNRQLVMIAGLVVVAVIAGIVIAIIASNSGGTAAVSGPPSSTTSKTPPSTPPSTSSTPTVAPVSGPIDWRMAGELIIDYYNKTKEPQTTWAMLSARLQQEFGSQDAFQQYWAGFKTVSARNARGVTPNQDGSVNVPVDVTYTNQDGSNRPERKVLKVIIENGRLAIDTDGR
jgi:eukaryotic-like serine/threonine-protein kinase